MSNFCFQVRSGLKLRVSNTSLAYLGSEASESLLPLRSTVACSCSSTLVGLGVGRRLAGCFSLSIATCTAKEKKKKQKLPWSLWCEHRQRRRRNTIKVLQLISASVSKTGNYDIKCNQQWECLFESPIVYPLLGSNQNDTAVQISMNNTMMLKNEWHCILCDRTVLVLLHET